MGRWWYTPFDTNDKEVKAVRDQPQQEATCQSEGFENSLPGLLEAPTRVSTQAEAGFMSQLKSSRGLVRRYVI
jgi:hypothetical protein